VNTTAKIALAASGGYILGRTKKMKLALALAMFLAGQKLPKSPVELLQQGAGALAKNEQFKELSQEVTGGLVDAGKAAAGRSAERWLTGVGDRLRDGLPVPGSDAGESDAESSSDAGDESDAESASDATDEADSSQDTDQEVDQDDEEETTKPAKKAARGRSRSSQSSGSKSRHSGSASKSGAAKGA